MEEKVRAQDYDRYLSALFARAGSRPHLFALYAFNHEIAKTAEAVSQPALGLIRLNWWRETIEEIYAGSVRHHETAVALASAIEACGLPRALLDAMIEAREADLEETPFGGMAGLLSYADATSGHVMRLAARILGGGDAFDTLAREAGIAYALAGLLRALPFRAARRNLVLPLESLRASGLSPEDIFDGSAGAPLKPIVAEIAARAMSHYRNAKAISVPRRFLPAFLPGSLVPMTIRVLTETTFDPLRHGTELPLHRRQWAMLAAVVRGNP